MKNHRVMSWPNCWPVPMANNQLSMLVCLKIALGSLAAQLASAGAGLIIYWAFVS